MKAEKQTVYMSIFYPQEKWHLLIHSLTKILRSPCIVNQVDRFLTFLNHHRGQGIRIAFDIAVSKREEVLKEISGKIKNFLLDNPAPQSSVPLPISSFFQSYPYNEIHYNLFNERVIKEGKLGNIQEIISEIILQNFNLEPISDAVVSNLLGYLNDSIHHVFSEDDSKYSMSNNDKTEYRCIIPLLTDLKKVAKQLSNEIGDPHNNHNEIMKTIQLHFYKMSNKFALS